ncbi:MAG TPA: hypothetical protein VFY46_02440, partial [Acidimicrobiia bacterium]|nr:hypothetical protein [Acidimicrobiia bacterium]
MPPDRRMVILVALLVVACGRGATTTTTTSTTTPTTTTTAAPTSTSKGTTTSTLPPGSYLLPVAAETMPESWTEVFLIPYGETPETLGTSLAGDGEGLQLGPDYGAQAPDGSWWFLDGAKQRMAHFGDDGTFIDAVEMPVDLLVDGLYFQFQLPRVLDDGTLVANRLGIDSTTILRLSEGTFETTALNRQFVPRTDDGVLLYGFDIENSISLEVDPASGDATETEWFRTRSGSRYRIAAAPGELTVSLPDAPVEHKLTFEAAEVGGSAFLSLEVAAGEDGTLHLFILGFPELDESLQLAGYLTITADGTLGALEPMR